MTSGSMDRRATSETLAVMIRLITLYIVSPITINEYVLPVICGRSCSDKHTPTIILMPGLQGGGNALHYQRGAI